MSKTILTIAAIAYLAGCYLSSAHADAACAGARNAELCRLAIMAGDDAAAARDAGN